MERDQWESDGEDYAGIARDTGTPNGTRNRVAQRYGTPLTRAIQRKQDEDTDRAPTIHDAATAAVDHRGSGGSVDSGVAQRVGDYLGADLSGVRVHDDSLSQEATAAMGARAFAYGNDVFLGPGERGNDLGLMAHELTHVVQQGAAGQLAPQRQVQVGDANTPAERQADAVSSAVTAGQPGATAAGTLLVDNQPLQPGQMLKSQFLEQLHAQVMAAAHAELGPIWSITGCPYIEQYFGQYRNQPAAAGEALLKRFAPGAAPARSAADMIAPVVARVREGVRNWRDTGQAPSDIAVAEPRAAAAGAAAVPPRVEEQQAQAMRAPDGRETLASLEDELGPGAPLDGTTASRMSSALGTDVSSTRIHTGPDAARKAADAGALAFAVGNNIVMGARAPAAGTIEGDALLAHELAHTAQQAGAAADPVARRSPIQTEDVAAEDAADQATVGAVARLAGRNGRGAEGSSSIASRFRGGLSLQRCSKDEKAEKIKALKKEKAELEAITAVGSGKSVGDVAAAFTKLIDVKHDLAVLETGTGIYEGTKSEHPTAGAKKADCTTFVLEVLKATFTQQGKGADWEKVEKKYKENEAIREKNPKVKKGLSGMDVQAALQSEAGWKGVYWAPDPTYTKIPKEELSKANPDEASYTNAIAGDKGTYYKDYATKGYPGVSVDQRVTNYAPEAPNAGHGDASKTKKDTTQLDKLKKLPFGVLSAHAGQHMTLIASGKVIEVHWREDATSVNVVAQSDLENWAVGSGSGFHYFASGVIVAPPGDVDAAFK